jgi:hypothetical protein
MSMFARTSDPNPDSERHTEKTASLSLDFRAKDLARPMLQVASNSCTLYRVLTLGVGRVLQEDEHDGGVAVVHSIHKRGDVPRLDGKSTLTPRCSSSTTISTALAGRWLVRRYEAG